jgi:hypothetical protein
MSVAAELSAIRRLAGNQARLVAVSKTQPVERILEAYQAGQRIFGENKAQELIAKVPQLPEDLEWHFIGHLQRNKVKAVLPHLAMIHGVDSLRLLKEINKEAARLDKKIPCLLQFHIAEEESKFGLNYEEALELLSSDAYRQMQHIEIAGVMGMATFTEDQALIRREFSSLYQIFEKLQAQFFSSSPSFREISMGMSNDFEIALEEGATLLRLGSVIFGERNR